jgi:hypothetical protein
LAPASGGCGSNKFPQIQLVTGMVDVNCDRVVFGVVIENSDPLISSEFAGEHGGERT